MRFVFLTLLVMAASAAAQRPTIEMRKIRTLVDVDGKGFTRAPTTIAPLSGGRYALAEMNELPMVVDSTGRIVKRFVHGSGPGEFSSSYTDAIVRGPGDSLYMANAGWIHVFDSNLKYARSISGISANYLVPVRDGFITSIMFYGGGGMIRSIGLINAAGKRIRVLVNDTIQRTQNWPPPTSTVLGQGDGSAFWAASTMTHQLERWSVDGKRLMAIDQAPPWFKQSATPGPLMTVHSLREANGVLWVLSRIPVPNAMEILRSPKRRGYGEADPRSTPTEQLFSTYLEAYDAATGRQLAELPIDAFGVSILDDTHVMLYTPSVNDTAQLEVWEMKLKR